MTSFVPPLLVPLEAVPAFAFAVAFLAGTLFPSCNPRRDRLEDPMVTRRPSAVTAARFGVFPWAHRTGGRFCHHRLKHR